MNFLNQHAFWWLWLSPFIIFVAVFIYRSRRARLRKISPQKIEDLMGLRFSVIREGIKTLLLAAAFVSLIFALARPRWGFEWVEVPRGGWDIAVVFDVSTSMLADDVPPTRLERAKRELIDLLKIMQGDRIAMIPFAGVAFVQCPLTIDERLATMFVEQISTTMVPVQGTMIGEGLSKAIQALKRGKSSGTQGQAIILITDGEDQGSDPMAAAKQAEAAGIKIFALGIGSEQGVPVPAEDGAGFKKDESGQVAFTKLDEKLLDDITKLTGGFYVQAKTQGDFGLAQIYQEGIRKKSELGKQNPEDVNEVTKTTSRIKVWYERFQLPVLFAFFFLFFEIFVSAYTRKRRNWSSGITGPFILIISLFAGFSTPKAEANEVSEAQKQFEAKNYSEARGLFEKAEIKDPEELRHSYNKGVADLFAHNYSDAEGAFKRSLGSSNKSLVQKSWYNLGHAFVGQKKWQEAYQAFDQAFTLNLDDKEALENKLWVEKKLKEEEQKPQDQNKDNKKDDQKDQDKNKQDQDQKKQDQKDENKKDDQQDKDQNNKQEQQKESNKDKDQENKDSSADKKDEEQKKEAQKNKANEEKKENKEPQPQAKDTASQQAEKDPKERPLKPDEVKQLLRVLEDNEQAYGLPYKPEQNDHPTKPKKDW